MNKNSIEEEIEILEELRTHGYAMLLMKYEDRIKTNRKIDQAIEHILSDYKRVLKENEELKKFITEGITIESNSPYQNYQLDFLRENFVPVQKVKDKIKEKKWALESYDCDEADYKQSQAIGAWQALQELLESEE